MMNEKCAACIHCEVCGFIESEVAREEACAFYEDGKRWELTKEEKALLQKWRDNRGISMKDFEDAMDALKQEPKFIAKSDGTIEQIKNCDDCIFRKEWEKIGELLSVILKKQTEQEPCGDAISRQAVLEQINCWIGSGEYRYTNATYYLTRRMQDLPPVTPQPKTGHWTPCSERLPKPKETENLIAKYYLVQNEYGDMMVARWDGKGWEQMYQHEYLEDEVVAWMPLPEPMKAESEG